MDETVKGAAEFDRAKNEPIRLASISGPWLAYVIKQTSTGVSGDSAPSESTMANPGTKFDPNPKINRTFAFQDKLPKLPIPPLEDTCRRYLKALEALQDEKEHEQTRRAVEDFLEGDGPTLQKRLQAWAETKARRVYL